MPRTKKHNQQGSSKQLQLLSPDEIGGELLNILSKGLYTDPLDAIREYIQNSIDANADEVQIQVTGNSVFIFDNGEGMTHDELIKARRFGVSGKSIEENVGFRGIGIYSGFDLCNRLVIRSKRKGEDTSHILEFRFGKMREILDEARQKPDRPVIPLQNLLYEHISSDDEAATEQIDKSYTIVQLEELSDNHIQRLSKIDEVSKYILHNLPVKFSATFAHAKKIEDVIKEHVHGYRSAKITLQIESVQVVIEKPDIPFVQAPEYGIITNTTTGEPVAFYWGCLTTKSEAISHKKPELKEFAGFVMKIKGFSIGDREKLRPRFHKQQVYPWWTGEIYITTTDVIPTSARDDLEAGLARDDFMHAVETKLNELSRLAEKAQQTRRAASVIESMEKKYNEIREKIENGTHERFGDFNGLNDIIDNLQTQRGKANPADKTKARKLIDSAKDMQERIRELDSNPEAVAERKRQTAKAIAEAALSRMDNPEPSVPPESSVAVQPASLTKGEEVVYSKSLSEVIGEVGYDIDDDCSKLLDLLDEILADNLGTNTSSYKGIITDFEERLVALMESE